MARHGSVGDSTVRLIERTGQWRPSDADGPAQAVAAFGQEDGEISAPGLPIRVRQDTTVAMTLRNALATNLRVFGLYSRPGPCEPVSVAAGGTTEVRFAHQG